MKKAKHNDVAEAVHASKGKSTHRSGSQGVSNIRDMSTAAKKHPRLYTGKNASGLD